MTTTLFLIFVAITAAGLIVAVFRFLPRATASFISIGLAVWLSFVGALGHSGILRIADLRPPAVLLIFLPVVVFAIYVGQSDRALRFATSTPLSLLLGAQSFRIGVELFFHRIWLEGLAPRMLTFEGANVDIAIGLSAPLAAWVSTRERPGLKLAYAWNGLGLLTLANVAIRAVLTTPGPLNLIHAEIANLSIGTFPFTYIAGFFAPLALVLHILAIRSLRQKYMAVSRCNPDTI